ncbi:MAG: hypothetical protein GY772_29030 [bacterium]|nr:hypothetical protein [bacterium]
MAAPSGALAAAPGPAPASGAVLPAAPLLAMPLPRARGGLNAGDLTRILVRLAQDLDMGGVVTRKAFLSAVEEENQPFLSKLPFDEHACPAATVLTAGLRGLDNHYGQRIYAGGLPGNLAADAAILGNAWRDARRRSMRDLRRGSTGAEESARASLEDSGDTSGAPSGEMLVGEGVEEASSVVSCTSSLDPSSVVSETSSDGPAPASGAGPPRATAVRKRPAAAQDEGLAEEATAPAAEPADEEPEQADEEPEALRLARAMPPMGSQRKRPAAASPAPAAAGRAGGRADWHAFLRERLQSPSLMHLDHAARLRVLGQAWRDLQEARRPATGCPKCRYRARGCAKCAWRGS